MSSAMGVSHLDASPYNAVVSSLLYLALYAGVRWRGAQATAKKTHAPQARRLERPAVPSTTRGGAGAGVSPDQNDCQRASATSVSPRGDTSGAPLAFGSTTASSPSDPCTTTALTARTSPTRGPGVCLGTTGPLASAWALSRVGLARLVSPNLGSQPSVSSSFAAWRMRSDPLNEPCSFSWSA